MNASRVTFPTTRTNKHVVTMHACLPRCSATARLIDTGRKVVNIPTRKSSPTLGSRKSRMLAVRARADASGPGSNDEPLYLPATASTYCPFSAELLLATTRLCHLERYREEVQQMYEPSMPVDLTRVALLISNIYQPQLDHRPYFEALEHLVAAAALAVMRQVSALTPGAVKSGLDSCGAFEGLDMQDPQHVLCAVQGVNQVLFAEERLQVNAADPHDPLNGSLTDLLDTCKGNQWSLAIVYLHILDGLGLPCAVVGSPEHIFVRVGEPPVLLLTDGQAAANSHPSPALLVDVSQPGQPGIVCAYPPPVEAHREGTLQSADSLARNDSSSSDEWNKALHTFLQQHQRGSTAEPTPLTGLDTADASGLLPSTSDSSSGTRADEFMDESTDGESSPWQELEVYAAQDAATRNSWKMLYGPGALREWGGSVTSSSSWGGSSEPLEPLTGTIGGMGAAEGLLGLDSPFAAAAAQPFPPEAAAQQYQSGGEETEVQQAGGAASSSMDTSWGSPADSLELDDFAASSSGSTGGGCGSSVFGDVVQLSWGDVAAMGGLQPVSKRMMLQQLLGAMKLSLMMSGRQEELMMVLRYLRATDPFSLPDLRDMALLLAETSPEEAAPLLREYLAVAPGAADADMVGEVLDQVVLRVKLGRANGWK